MRILTVLASLSLCLLVTSPVHAQGDPDPLWIDVNIGAAIAAEEGHTVLVEAPFRAETLRFQADYRRPPGGVFDFGAGYMFHPRIGVGMSFAGTGHVSDATIAIRVPNPFLANQPVSDFGTSDRELWWNEAMVHLQAMFKLTPVESRFVARLFGGPTYFAVRQEAVSDFGVTESLSLTTGAYQVGLNEYVYTDAEGSGWGFHVGADAGYFFNNHVGIGGMFRFNRATVDLQDPLLAEIDRKAEVTVGGVQFGGGLRLKF